MNKVSEDTAVHPHQPDERQASTLPPVHLASEMTCRIDQEPWYTHPMFGQRHLSEVSTYGLHHPPVFHDVSYRGQGYRSVISSTKGPSDIYIPRLIT